MTLGGGWPYRLEIPRPPAFGVGTPGPVNRSILGLSEVIGRCAP